MPTGAYDYVFTCLPYHNLERYSDHPADLSAMKRPGLKGDAKKATQALLVPEKP
ncbi:hypothetical protein [Streptomyces roseochromogenus]|uniref:Uncharacterized protein n=1 Tax=Streptomyces roseochromogenus subsp. oscitans DS 12.976 TaxID=1352936 RepID=V6KDW2_STRRC|nr:hypothetical protein [Streptomyces roseochromogenus]EST29641.1 hypothetical protein M878_20130 [Streptomyces roseochromogenus subsp. oscitans DS 12.976]